jgi:copper chaperone
MAIQIFLVGGMTCKNCKGYIETVVKNVDGVEEVQVDLTTGHVKVAGEHVNITSIKTVIEKGGYSFKGELKPSSPGSDLWLS